MRCPYCRQEMDDGQHYHCYKPKEEKQMAEIIQHHYKDDDIQYDIIVKARSIKCHSAITDMTDTDKEVIKDQLQIVALTIEPFVNYEKK